MKREFRKLYFVTGDLLCRLANKDKGSICFRHVFNMRLHEGALNEAINYAQKGCAVQIGGMTLRGVGANFFSVSLLRTQIHLPRYASSAHAEY